MIKSATNRLFDRAMDFAAILQQAPPAGARLPLQRQLLQRFKNAILDGRLAPGSRLPASRALAQQLGISRNTVLLAYEHLAAEGYVRADRQGTRVAGQHRPGRRLACRQGHR
ncbi:winged helix-turn-helix domain-containing protein, partial [Bordetella bronchiseptica]|uniref:winged helix-turn-helix domain-containing protein n=1 Tax=Bordetella bronchiseptica TaxID=518 RepID=UPI002FDA5F66